MMRSIRLRFPTALSLLIAAAAFTGGGWVTSARAQALPDVDPPGRVARLAEFQGAVWLYSPDTNEWTGAVRNRPLTSGDRISTEPGSRAELQVGSTTIRLDASTELGVAVLDDDHVSLQLVDGSVGVRVRDLGEAGKVDVRTDAGRFLVQQAGRYRMDRTGRSSFVTVYTGQAYYEALGSGLAVQPGQRAEFFIDANNVAQYGLTTVHRDAFSAWNNERDQLADRSVSARYVSPAVTGIEELDRYGAWEQDPEYGALWIPQRVAVDWVPYSTGHWAWVRPWGWTWVDDAPWGFAPFHYGRWVHVRNTWCWSPGVRVARPVYAPALVAWVGGGAFNAAISVGPGRSGGPAVGWFPLAPREVYVPSYRASARYGQNINVTHVTNISIINRVITNPQAPREFRNRYLPNALTVVPSAVLSGRQPVAAAAAQWRRAPGSHEAARHLAPIPVSVNPPVAAPVMVAPADRERGRDGGRNFGDRRQGDDTQRRGATGEVGRPAIPTAAPPVLVAPQAPNSPRVLAPAPAPADAPAAFGRSHTPGSPRGVERRSEDPAPAVRDSAAPAVRVMPAPVAGRPNVVPSVPAAAAVSPAPADANQHRRLPRDPSPTAQQVAPPVLLQEHPRMRPQPVQRSEERPAAAPATPRVETPREVRADPPARPNADAVKEQREERQRFERR